MSHAANAATSSTAIRPNSAPHQRSGSPLTGQTQASSTQANTDDHYAAEQQPSAQPQPSRPRLTLNPQLHHQRPDPPRRRQPPPVGARINPRATRPRHPNPPIPSRHSARSSLGPDLGGALDSKRPPSAKRGVSVWSLPGSGRFFLPTVHRLRHSDSGPPPVAPTRAQLSPRDTQAGTHQGECPPCDPLRTLS